MPLVRIIMHWSAGGHSANSNDRKHYHEIVEGDGTRVEGDLLPEANNSTGDGNYAAHTRMFNTGSIGLSMAAMEGAKENPFDAGSAPITPEQLEAFVAMVAEYADTRKYVLVVGGTELQSVGHQVLGVSDGVKSNSGSLVLVQSIVLSEGSPTLLRAAIEFYFNGVVPDWWAMQTGG